jgi:PEP-CTERM motif
MLGRKWIARFLVAALVACSASQVQAGLLPVSVSVLPEGSNYRWTYAIVLPTDSKLQSGNFFTIYDFHGYVAGGESAPADWTFEGAMSGPTPALLNPSDNPDVMNLTWRYNGPTIPSGQIGLGNFWAISTIGEARVDSFTAITNRTSDGVVDSNITETDVPVAPTTPTDPNLVPEPTTLLLAGLGLPLVGLARLRRKTT